MVRDCNDPTDAGNVARAFTGGGKTDWSLPSLYELANIHDYPNRAAVGGFNSGYYWSSTDERLNKDGALSVNFGDGKEYGDGKWNTHGVRPIRAW
jgi:hypothetical protein